MKKALVFGASSGGFNYIEIQDKYDIIGLVDNDSLKHGSFYRGVKIYSPVDIKKMNFDYIIIASMYIKAITKQLTVELGVDSRKIIYAPKSMMKIKNNPFEDYKTLEKAKSLLIRVTKYLEEKGYSYFINFGTLLGIVREGNLLPWDDDIDIAIVKNFTNNKIFINQMEDFFRMVIKNDKFQVVSLLKSDKSKKILGIDFKISSEENISFVISLDLLYINEESAYLPIDILPSNFFQKQDNVYLDGNVLRAPFPKKEYLTYVYKDWNVVKKNVTFNDNTTSFNEPEWIEITTKLIE